MVVGGLDRRQFRCPHRRHQQAYVLHVSRAAGGCRRGAAIDRRGCDGSSTVDMDCRRIRIPLSLFKVRGPPLFILTRMDPTGVMPFFSLHAAASPSSYTMSNSSFFLPPYSY